MNDPKSASEAFSDLWKAVAEALRLQTAVEWMADHLLLSKVIGAALVLAFWVLLAWETGLLG